MYADIIGMIRVWRRHFKVYRKRYFSSVTLNFVEPILYLLAMGLGLGGYIREIDGLPYTHFLAPGIILSSAAFAATFECTYGSYVRMTFQKNFDALLSTPITIRGVVGGEILWGATKSLIYGTIIAIVVTLAGLISSPWLMALAPVIFLAGVIFASLALIVTAVIPGIDQFNYYFTLVMTPMYLFSGIFFPLHAMPDVVQMVAYFTPLYHAVAISRALASGALELAVAGHLFAMLVMVSITVPLAYTLIRRRLIGSV
ncbi:ABC transporter permease [Chrysiogenes arsenatis]|uniref:ABC transporter permease n=1 Tax=Chrysiogenes arsenatis TaxID=309797 RepID=UPI0004267341|nr:ABC transporter permease [Chrysiogenes arsenatis]